MTRLLRRLILATTCLLCTNAGTASADWQPNGTLLTPPPHSDQATPVMVADGQGGATMTWNEQNLAAIQHLTASGDPFTGWAASGTSVNAGIPNTDHAAISPAGLASDGDGGVFVATYEQGPWYGDNTTADPWTLYVHRFTSTGAVAPGWAHEGVRIQTGWEFFRGGATILDSQFQASLVPDGHGGVLMAWLESGAPGVSPLSIVVQSVVASGVTHWTSGGIKIRGGLRTVSRPVLVVDRAGGALVFWSERDSLSRTAQVMGQRITPSGSLAWGTGGRRLTRDGFDRIAGPVAISDEEHGAIIAWAGSRGRDTDVFAARVTPAGELPWRGDERVCAAAGDQSQVSLLSDRRGGALLGWLDGRDASQPGVYAQRLSHEGRAEWTRNGVAVCVAPGSRGPLAMANDGREDTFLAWGDSRPEGELYAMRLTAKGERAEGWPENGAVVSRHPLDPYSGALVGYFGGVALAPGLDGTAMLAWQDSRVIPGPGVVALDFAMLLTPTGPAAAPPELRSAAPVISKPGLGAPRTAPAFALYSVFPNPSLRAASVTFALPDASPATLELLDLSGRRLWFREVGASGPGEHMTRVAEGAGIRAGVYFVRLTQGARSATARVTVLE